MEDKTKIFIEKAKLKHGDKYNYSKSDYTKSEDKILIICPIHGEFFKTPHEHLRGKGCGECGKLDSILKRRRTKESFIEQAEQIHKNKYDYSKLVYVNDKTKVEVICPKHGEFMITPGHFLDGEGCRKCGIERRANRNRKNLKNFIEQAKKIHDERYDYSESIYICRNNNVKIICSIHGEFQQSPANHVRGQGCPQCGKISFTIKNRDTTEDFIKKSNKVHDFKYDYSNIEYVNSKEKVKITCPIHGDFEQKPSNHINGQGCKKCFQDKSKVETEVYDYIKASYSGEIIENSRKILEGNKEIDIYIPEYKIGFEIDGLIWHSDKYQEDKKYHLKKTLDANSKGIKLIHIFEDEWWNKKEIIKSIISSMLKTNKRIYARNCTIKEVDSKESKKFLDENHLQGNIYGSTNIGLYYNDELVSLMVFGKNRRNMGKKNIEGEYEMFRFCNKKHTSVIGGASKLLKYFVNTIKPIKITTYADRRYSDGNLYNKIGFKLIRESEVNYFYVDNKKRLNRYNLRKDVLVKMGFDPNKTELEITREMGLFRIYDCGNFVFELTYGR